MSSYQQDNVKFVEKVKDQIKHQLNRKTEFRFKLIRIRIKISYLAFVKTITIAELIL